MWSNPGFIGDFLRGFFSILDSIGYFFLSGIFNIFFTIANAEIFQGSVINTFYSRIQMILGILMIFRISITLLQIIINPDLFKDKQKGAGSIVMRIAVMLILLTLIVPINIPNTNGNPLNEQIKSNGILFGFLYQFQNSIVEDNILGKLILGSDTDTTTSNSGGTQLPGMASVGDVITSEIAKAFITPAINDGYDDINKDNYKEAAVCPDVVSPYFNPLVTSGSLIDHVNDTCTVNGSEAYAFDYTGFGGVVCAVVMTIIIIGFTLDIAVRAIKLALLRLIAPVPIISYISPGQEKDGAFGNWVKTLTSTYLSLFIRLIIIYFGIYLIIILREGDLVSWVHTSNALTTGLANIFIIIGILVFMKDAPKFFQDMLGIKGDGKLFSGIGTMLGAAALTGGLAGSAIGSFRTGMSEGKELGYGTGRSVLRGIGAGAGGLLGGAFVGTKALATADKNAPSAVMAAMQKRNAMRGTGSTLLGRVGSNASAMFLGSSLGGKAAQKAELFDSLTKAAQSHKSMVEDEALKSTTAEGTLSYLDHMGSTQSLSANYQDFYSQYEAAKAAGKNTFSFTDSAGRSHVISTKSINANRLEDFKQSQATNYLASADGRSNVKIAGTAKDLEYAAAKVDMDIDAYKYGGTPADKVKGIKGVIGASINEARAVKSDPRTQWKIANDKATNNNNK